MSLPIAIPCGTIPPMSLPSKSTTKLSAVTFPITPLSAPTTLPSGITFPNIFPLKFIAVISCAKTELTMKTLSTAVKTILLIEVFIGDGKNKS